MEYKKKKPTLESLRTGRPTLNNADPAEWLIRAIGSDQAKAAIMFGRCHLNLLCVLLWAACAVVDVAWLLWMWM